MKLQATPECRQRLSEKKKGKRSYERTVETNAKLSAALRGKRHNWRSASTRPDVAAKIAAWWTPERREARRQRMLLANPEARYHGLSHRQTQKMRDGASCLACGATSRLDIHHKDRDKRNQSPDNLEVLCHQCHMREHARAGDLKRKNHLSQQT